MTKREQYLLTCLMEECSEVQKEASKIIRGSMDAYNADKQHWINLIEELHDVLCLMEKLQIVQQQELILRKHNKLAEYLRKVEELDNEQSTVHYTDTRTEGAEETA